MRIPSATYRLQFHNGLDFAAARELVDYLYALGVSDVYASPIFKACTGSQHGYDVVNHDQIDPALGGEEGLRAFCAALQAKGMGLILDIVPNHMGIGETSNAWWMDVLENGPSSMYADYFDIDWHPANPHLANKVLLPILEDQYGIVLEDGKLRLAYEEGAFFLYYYDNKLPIAPRTYGEILSHEVARLAETLGKDHDHLLEYQSILTAIGHLPLRTEAEPDKREERRREKEIVKRRITTLYQTCTDVKRSIDHLVETFNGKVGVPQSFDLLDRLIETQPYRLAFWRVAGEEINYRRFFDINQLAAIRTEAPDVFQATHQLLLRLAGEGLVTGLRIDHPDGLLDPAAYFRQLQQSLAAHQDKKASGGDPGRSMYVVAEKILSKGESLPADWAIAGTTGYDFLNQVNGLFVRRASRAAFDKIYNDFTGTKSSYHELIHSRKRMIMLVSLASEINALSHRLDDISERNRHYRDFTLNGLTFAIREVIACLAIYRTYVDGATGQVSARDRRYIEAAVADAKRRNPRTARAIFDFIGDTLALKNLGNFRPEDRPAIVEFVMKFQQLTGPVMAKGVEDTAFYIYNRLISLNEVGGEPVEFGSSLEGFHQHNSARLESWPHSLLTLSTHDTKRGEDARARIDVLSELAPDWRAALTRWHRMNAAHKTVVDGKPAPARNDEYLFYQTLIGSWPVGALDADTLASFRDRVVAYMQKAIKEAKVHTSWVNANEAYDRAMDQFVREVLSTPNSDTFLRDVAPFVERVALVGMVNSLAQTLLKLTAPGVPDFYQGAELWELSMVDPDNRRPVDFAARRALLATIQQAAARQDRASWLADLIAHWPDGRVKLYLIYQALQFRRRHRELLDRGEYLTLHAEGKLRHHLCAFARRLSGQWMLTGVPRLWTRLTEAGTLPLGAAVWQQDALMLPVGAPAVWRNVLTGETLTASEAKAGRKVLLLCDLLASFPVVLLEG